MMEHLPENNSVQGNRPAAIQPTTLGNMLREARERLGLSVADVAGQIKFAPRQIEALEADDFKRLPEATFLRGFVRSYAKILRLDAETLLAALPQPKAAVAELIPASVEVPFPNAHSVRQQNLIWLGAASLLAVIVVGFAVWHFKTPLKQSKEQSKVAQVETPVALPAEVKIISEPLELKPSMVEPSVPAVPKVLSSVRAEKTLASKAAPQVQSTDSVTLPDVLLQTAKLPQTTELRLVFGEESWTEIKDKDGNILSSQINPRGSELRLEGSAPFSMLIGHAASARLYYQGKQVDLTPYINEYSEVAHLKLK
jgi:cytoskeleton protein RodZ